MFTSSAAKRGRAKRNSLIPSLSLNPVMILEEMVIHTHSNIGNGTGIIIQKVTMTIGVKSRKNTYLDWACSNMNLEARTPST